MKLSKLFKLKCNIDTAILQLFFNIKIHISNVHVYDVAFGACIKTTQEGQVNGAVDGGMVLGCWPLEQR